MRKLKHWRFFALTILPLALLCGAAEAAIHFEAITEYNGRVYALRTSETDYTYSPSAIVEYDANLSELRSIALGDDASGAKNSLNLAVYNGRLYVGSVGGSMGGSGYGDVWEVDIASGAAAELLSLEDINDSPTGIYGIKTASDGTVFLLTGAYDADFNFGAALFITTVSDLTAGNAGTRIPLTSDGGYSWSLAWSEFDQTLWVMAGKSLQARDKSGTLLRTFTPSELGNNIYTLAPLEGRTGLFYTAAADDYSSNSAGFITKSGSDYTVRKDVIANFTGDTAGFAFKNHNGDPRIFLREFDYGPDDSVSIYKPDDFSAPVLNASDWGASNIHAVAALGDYLYYATYASYAPEGDAELDGKVGRINMPALMPGDLPDVPDVPTSPTNPTSPTSPTSPTDTTNPTNSTNPARDGGGGGCDAGMGVIVLLLLVPMALNKYRKK